MWIEYIIYALVALVSYKVVKWNFKKFKMVISYFERINGRLESLEEFKKTQDQHNRNSTKQLKEIDKRIMTMDKNIDKLESHLKTKIRTDQMKGSRIPKHQSMLPPQYIQKINKKQNHDETRNRIRKEST